MDENLELYLMYDAIHGPDTFEILGEKKTQEFNDLENSINRVNSDLQNLFKTLSQLGEIND